jgi:hypothetical protein
MKTAELTPKDLMVGDWVIFHDSGHFSDGTTWEENRVCQIDGIDEDVRVKWYDESGCKEDWPHVSTVFLSPIPLTSKILEKNGMHLYNRNTNSLMEECNHSDCFEEDEDYRVELSLDYDGKIRWTINGDEYTIMPLDYVHQLQNALRLCDVPKEITL